jgi:hypothetical protein
LIGGPDRQESAKPGRTVDSIVQRRTFEPQRVCHRSQGGFLKAVSIGDQGGRIVDLVN